MHRRHHKRGECLCKNCSGENYVATLCEPLPNVTNEVVMPLGSGNNYHAYHRVSVTNPETKKEIAILTFPLGNRGFATEVFSFMRTVLELDRLERKE